MPNLRNISREKCIKVLCNKFWFIIVRKKGSHVILRKEELITVVPYHNEIKIKTLKNVLKLVQVDIEDFSEYI